MQEFAFRFVSYLSSLLNPLACPGLPKWQLKLLTYQPLFLGLYHLQTWRSPSLSPIIQIINEEYKQLWR